MFTKKKVKEKKKKKIENKRPKGLSRAIEIESPLIE